MLAQWSRRLTDITFNLFADRSIGLSRKLRHGSHQANPSVVFFFCFMAGIIAKDFSRCLFSTGPTHWVKFSLPARPKPHQTRDLLNRRHRRYH